MSTPRPLSDFPLLDTEGTRMSLGSRVEQVVVEEAHGALRSRLHQHGEIIGRDRHLVYVRFEQEWQHLVTLRPHHLRVLNTPDGH
ncbi:MAG: hypothetical protein WCF33_12365 [Pseudonocardiaceae bacterium]